MGDHPLDQVLAAQPPPFALIHRPHATGPERLEVLVGEVEVVPGLADLPLPADHPSGSRWGPGGRHELLAVVPYRQIVERGYACHDDGAPLLAVKPVVAGTCRVADALARLPGAPVALRGAGFDVSDAAYAAEVRRVVREEIGAGEGSNFVLSRSFVATLEDRSPRSALAVFRRLLARETGAYWTFIVHTGDLTLIGATPERHISLHGGTAVMNPISGTYRYGPSGPNPDDALRFLADAKETDELYMVVDEELKMMAQVCDEGGRVHGPYIKEMTRLAHTEYFIEGRSTLDVREVLRRTMFAPTVTGSPLESSCRAIRRHERVAATTAAPWP